MERLRDLGLVQIQPSRPRLFAALPPEAVVERVGVVDDDMVVLPQDHPFAPGGRFASLLVRDRDLAERWRSASTARGRRR